MFQQELTAAQHALVETWERHMAAEFDTQSIEATMATMTDNKVAVRERAAGSPPF